MTPDDDPDELAAHLADDGTLADHLPEDCPRCDGVGIMGHETVPMPFGLGSTSMPISCDCECHADEDEIAQAVDEAWHDNGQY